SANSPRAVVRIEAVLEHPMQGDLHHPYQTQVALFHERKASANGEHVLVHLSSLQAYDAEVPAYNASLQTAYEALVNEMKDRDDDYGNHALRALDQLKKEYGF